MSPGLLKCLPCMTWIDMGPPGGGTTLSVVAPTDALPTGVDTGIRFLTPDARAAQARLMDLGLRVGELLDWPTAPFMFPKWRRRPSATEVPLVRRPAQRRCSPTAGRWRRLEVVRSPLDSEDLEAKRPRPRHE